MDTYRKCEWRYEDEYQKLAGHWLFKSRNYKMVHIQTITKPG